MTGNHKSAPLDRRIRATTLQKVSPLQNEPTSTFINTPMSTLTRLILSLATFVLLSSALSANPPELKMTTPVPEGVATPDSVETPIGILNSVSGVPDVETSRRIYDNLDFQRAQQAYLSTIQISSMYAMEQGLRKFGPVNTTVLSFEDRMDSKALWLTPNTVNVYNAVWMEIDDEPMVIETPPNVLGLINDAWFLYVADFGNAGPDHGQGGKFLIVPHDYAGEIPDGYHVAKTHTKGHWVIWRGFPVDGSTKPAVEATREHFRMYPLSQRHSPPEMTFKNISGIPNNTIHRMDFGFWEELNQQIQDENLAGLSPEIRGLLASIGIEKGKPFEPDARMKRILTDAANIGAVTVRTLAARPRDQAAYLYPGESYWATPFIGGSHEWLNDGARLLDARAMFHFYATGITPAMTSAPVGKGSQYAMCYLDQDGKPLDGSNTYKITLPKDIPIKNFWSVTLYDNQTRSMLQTDERFPGLSSVDQTPPEPNPDGSYDIYFGPTAPPGKENNWLQTVPGKGWNMLLRLYSPLQPWFDKTWRPSDPVRMK
jgi:hypothetical protein